MEGPKVSAELKWNQQCLLGAQAQAAISPPLSYLGPRPAISYRHRVQSEWDSVSLRSAWARWGALLFSTHVALHSCRAAFPLSFPRASGGVGGQEPQDYPGACKAILSGSSRFMNKWSLCLCRAGRMEDEPLFRKPLPSILLRVMLWVSVIHM